jgi:opacity protein-like surface antigen
MPGKLSDVQMPLEGERQAQAQFPQFVPNNVFGNKLTSSLSGSNISLKNSAIFGGKAGYFFKDEGFSWLGVELEAFTTQPTIKQQTVTTTLDATYIPGSPGPGNEATSISQPGTLQLTESSMRLVTVLFNVVARYPGTTFQPYVGVGGGAFHFSASGQDDIGSLGQILHGISGRQVVPGLNAQAGLKVLATEEWSLFVEGKYNYATITNLDPVGVGLSGVYSAFNAVAGVAYHF